MEVNSRTLRDKAFPCGVPLIEYTATYVCTSPSQCISGVVYHPCWVNICWNTCSDIYGPWRDLRTDKWVIQVCRQPRMKALQDPWSSVQEPTAKLVGKPVWAQSSQAVWSIAQVSFYVFVGTVQSPGLFPRGASWLSRSGYMIVLYDCSIWLLYDIWLLYIIAIWLFYMIVLLWCSIELFYRRLWRVCWRGIGRVQLLPLLQRHCRAYLRLWHNYCPSRW